MFKKGKDTLVSNAKSFYDLEANDIDGNLIKMSQYQERKLLLIVNVASNCGLTKKSYSQLNEIYDQYRKNGLEILAFPCNDFMSQEPGCGADIKKMVTEQYKAQFPLFEKIVINGPQCHPVYAFLRSNSQELNSIDGSGVIPWNFAKFFVKNGQVIKFNQPTDDPLKLKPFIEENLQ